MPAVNFPPSQLFVPVVPYPEWHANWDFREPGTKPEKKNRKEKKKKKKDTKLGGGDETAKIKKKKKKTPVHGPQRHIILVRHGQYDETFPDDERRVLTPLGRAQAAAPRH